MGNGEEQKEDLGHNESAVLAQENNGADRENFQRYHLRVTIPFFGRPASFYRFVRLLWYQKLKLARFFFIQEFSYWLRNCVLLDNKYVVDSN